MNRTSGTKITTVLAAAVAMAAALAACLDRQRVAEAEIIPETTEPPRVLADRNRDGRVTREEAKISPALTAQFDRYDQDKDNVLNRVEFARLEEQHTPPALPQDGRHQLRPRPEFPRPYE